MKIAVAFDHGGYLYKKTLIDFLKENGHEVVDFGTDSTESCDYPDFGGPASQAVANGECDRGILICGTGIGMSMVANKVKGVRCALVHDCFTAKATREHNDSNVLAVGQRVIGEGLMLEIVNIWLNTNFTAGRHQKRIDKVMSYENN